MPALAPNRIRRGGVLAIVSVATLLAGGQVALANGEDHDRPMGDGHHGHAQRGHAGLDGASARERRQAERLRRSVHRSAAARFPTYRAARRQGYERLPMQWKRPVVFHLRRPDYVADGRIFDPRRPESLVYWWPTRGAPVLIGFMFRVPKGPRPAFAGPIPTYHQHMGETGPGDPMTHVWLTAELHSAWASCLPVPELEAAIPGFDHMPRAHASSTPESRPCPSS